MATTVTTVDDFIEAIRKSGFLADRQMDEVIEASDGVSEPTAVARELVRRQLLSRWQASQILANKTPAYLGKYKLLDLIGSGGVTSVYLAEHEQMERRVVLKTIVPAEDSDPESSRQFLAEATKIASLDHRNLIHTYDVEREGESYCLVMEHVEGEELQALVDRDGPLRPEEAANYIAMAASGLADAHAHGICHHAIKPDRLLVRESGDLKLLDIGMAQLADPKEATTVRTAAKLSGGDVDYLAPEQATGRNKVDQRADIYSLGATFFFLLTGHVPYPKGTDEERLKARLRKKPPSVLAERPKTPAPLAELCSQMMATQPRERTARAEEVSNCLRAWLKANERPAAARPPRPAKKRPKRSDSDSDSGSFDSGTLDLDDLGKGGLESMSGIDSAEPLAVSKKRSADGKEDDRPGAAAKKRSPVLLGAVVGGGGVLAVIAVAAFFLLLRGDGEVGPTGPASTGTATSAAPSAFAPTVTGGLAVRSVTATGGVKLEAFLEGDGSYLIADESANPDRTTYTIIATSEFPEITGFRLELLDDASLPLGGPGRAEEGGFSVSELEVYAAPTNQFFAMHRQRLGQADSESGSENDSPSHAADRNIATSWVVASPGGEPQSIDFLLQKPIVLEQIGPGDGKVWIKFVVHQEMGDKYTIGRFRWTALTAEDVEPTGDRTVPPILETNPTVAYWRFEEGKPSEEVPSGSTSGTVAAVDASGNNNHLYAMAASVAPQSVARKEGDVVGATDVSNTMALDTTAAPGRGANARYVMTDAMRSRPEVDIKRVLWDRWTLEASFRLPELSGKHVILAKGGKPTAGTFSPVELAVDGEDKRIVLTIVDADGKQQQVTTDPEKLEIEANRWYHIAAVCDGKTLELRVNNPTTGKGLDVQGTTPLEKPLIDSIGRWQVGCGFHDGAPAGRSQIHIDEVRLSAGALADDQLLYHGVGGSAESADPGTDVPETPIAFHPLVIKSVSGGTGVTYVGQSDGSYLVGGTSYDKINYIIEASTDVRHITGFRLEVLADPSLPGDGPGRHETEPNEGKLAITQFEVQVTEGAKGARAPVKFAKAEAGVGETTVANAIDGDAKTAWVVDQRLGKSHWALFETEAPIGLSEKTLFKITLHHSTGGKSSTGRFRISLRTGSTDGEPPGSRLLADRKRLNRFKRTEAAIDPMEIFANESVGRQSFDLGSVYLEENDTLEVALLGGAEGNGAKGTFALAKSDGREGIDEGWDIQYAPSSGSPVRLGEVVRNNQDLTLKWQPPQGQDPEVKFFFNGVLKLTVGGSSHQVTLRESVVAQPLAYSLDRRRKDVGPARMRIQSAPSVDTLRVQIRPNPRFFEEVRFDPEDTMAISEGTSTILLGKQGEGGVVLRVQSEWSAGESVVEIKAKAFIRPPAEKKPAGAEGVKKTRRGRKPKKAAPLQWAMIKSARAEKVRLENEDRFLAQAVARRKEIVDASKKGPLKPDQIRDWRQVKGVQKEMVDLRRPVIQKEIKRLGALIKQAEILAPDPDGPPITIDLRIFRVVDGAELDLVRTTGWPSD